jgi:hypothetical protein
MEAALSQLATPDQGSALTGRAFLESRIATHDGYIWPYERRLMQKPGPIRERMVEDIGRLVTDGGEDAVVTLADLARLGWPQGKVEEHGKAAFAIFAVQQAALSQLATPDQGSALTGRAFLESRIATHDGYIWPYERRLMQKPGPIRERMVEDIGRLVTDGGEDAVVTLADLARLGWPQGKVEEHGKAAFAIFAVQQAAKERRRVDRPARIAAEAAALLLFCGTALFWAGVGAGAL